MATHDYQIDFPILNPLNNDKPIIYLDTACQSLRPRQVIEAMNRYYTKFPACSGRSNHQLAATVTRLVDEARQQMARFLGASRMEEIIFTRNTTEAINLVANAYDFQPGDTILIGNKEHNSNLIPWQMLVKRRGVQLKILHTLTDGSFDLPGFEQALADGVKLVSFGYTSNLDGVTLPVEQIIKLAHNRGAL
ncbi:MAG: aminotransferase class V-fold PLP-dependent enzyme, partial [Anaerolineaceae bacterium]|nr:aminotransferase class V-fold PLP-dependent enzyme [Anaerolineaceae bacterium]